MAGVEVITEAEGIITWMEEAVTGTKLMKNDVRNGRITSPQHGYMRLK
jgi:hypothetical protein